MPLGEERHHLIPSCISKRNKYTKMPQLEKGKETISICCNCHDQIHKLFTEKELADNYNTLELIMSDEKVQKWIKWIQNKPNDFSVCMKTKKKR